MLFILPADDVGKEGFDGFNDIVHNSKNDGRDFIRHLTYGFVSHDIVKIKLPKFTIESEIDLKEPLQKLGVKAIFEGDANLSKLAYGGDGLKVDKVIHKAKLTIDEKGTVAGAGTAVTMVTKGLYGPDEITFDRPFLCYIYKDKTGDVLFSASIVNPKK